MMANATACGIQRMLDSTKPETSFGWNHVLSETSAISGHCYGPHRSLSPLTLIAGGSVLKKKLRVIMSPNAYSYSGRWQWWRWKSPALQDALTRFGQTVSKPVRFIRDDLCGDQWLQNQIIRYYAATREFPEEALKTLYVFALSAKRTRQMHV